MRIRTAFVVLLGAAWCLSPGGAASGGEAPPRPDAPAPRVGQPAAGDVMAYVNGQPIAMEALNDILIAAYGRPVGEQLVARELARQAGAKAGLSVTKEEADAEHLRTLQQMFARLGPSDKAEEHLDRFLAQRNMSRSLWRVIMERNALLRKLAPKNTQVTEEDMREQFGRAYGRKVVVRHVQTNTLADAQKVKELADKKIDFTLLVTRYSTHESRKNGGLLPPVGRDTEQLTPAIREAALAMRTIGEISNPIQAGTSFHVLKLEQIIEPQNVKYADVKDKIAEALRENRVRIFQNQLLQRLIGDAKIQYVNPVLKAQDEKARAEARIGTPEPP